MNVRLLYAGFHCTLFLHFLRLTKLTKVYLNNFQVIDGMLQGHPSVITNCEQCIQLFIHECSCVFLDRLVNVDDRKVFYESLSDTLLVRFQRTWTPSALENTPHLFGDFMEVNNMSGTGNKVYRLLQYQNVVRVLEVSQVIKPAYIVQKQRRKRTRNEINKQDKNKINRLDKSADKQGKIKNGNRTRKQANKKFKQTKAKAIFEPTKPSKN